MEFNWYFPFKGYYIFISSNLLAFLFLKRLNMNYKNIILYCFKKNTYFYNFLLEHYKPSLEQAIVSRIEDLKKDDTLQDLSNLNEFRKRIRTDNLPFYSHNINQTNFRLYGISQSLFGNKNKNIYFLPSVEHGLIFQDTNWSDTS